MVKVLFGTVVILLFASLSAGEYYKYTDENGNILFTDDISRIPVNQRDVVKKFDSVKNSGTEKTGDISSTIGNVGIDTTNESANSENTPPTNDTFEARANELNRLNSELNKTREALEKERSRIQAQIPDAEANNNEKIAYSMKVDALNLKIEKYEEKLKAFEEKVEAFNNRGRPVAK